MTSTTAVAIDPPRAGSPSPRRAFTDLSREHGFEPLRVEGTLPRELAGTLFRNGPGCFGAAGRRYRHWFDADGAITAIRFREGRAEGAARLVQTRGLLEERRQGRALYGGYGTTSPRGALTRFWTSDRKGVERLLDAKNTANTSVMMDGGRLLALWEGGRPTALDPDTLSTLGETDLGGAIDTFSAHPHDVPSRRATYNIGARFGPRCYLDIYERPYGGRFARIGRLPLPGAVLVHDFAVTSRHIVIHAAPLRLDLFRTAFNLGSPSDNFAWRPELGSELIVAPLDDLARIRRIPADPRWIWHFANAHDGDAGRVLVDAVAYDDFASNDVFGSLLQETPRGNVSGCLTRLTIEPGKGRPSWEVLADAVADYPVVAPRVSGSRHRYVYLAAVGRGLAGQLALQNRIVKADVDSGRHEELELGTDLYLGEPLFVPRSGGASEDDGWLLPLVYDARTHASHVAVIDAQRLGDGPVARAWFDHHIPPGFHGTWAPARPLSPH